MAANVEPIFPRIPFLVHANLDNSDLASPRTIGTGSNSPKVLVNAGVDGALVGDLWAQPISSFSTVVLLFFHRNSGGQWNLCNEFQVQAVTNSGAAIARQTIPMPFILSPSPSTVDKKTGYTLGPDEALGVAVLTEIPGAQTLGVWAMGGYY
ncbi:MAG: hypothetical protein HC890_07870 [Chloroflexaceae bacterium]|nr:hypothetical protein [Chloroflexaceae bacterium]